MIIGVFQNIDWTGQKRREASSLCVCKITAPIMEGMIEEIVDYGGGEDVLLIRKLPKNRLGLSNDLGQFIVNRPHDFKEGDIVKVEVGENRRIRSVNRTGGSVSFFVTKANGLWITLFIFAIVFLMMLSNNLWIALFLFAILSLIILLINFNLI